MADDNKILLKIQVEKGGSTVTLKNFENQVIKSGVAVKDLSNAIGNFTAGRLKMDGQVKLTTDQFKRLEKSVGGFKTATGASTSATLELGRVLSDMPYGIRGVANNLQQLASNLFFMSKATDAATGKSVGFLGAIGKVLKGLIGPAGILIAFQGIIAAFDFFSQKTKKAEEDLGNFGGTVAKSGSNLKILKQALEEGTISTEEANKAVNKANLEYKDLNLKLDENNQLTKDSVERIDDKIDAIERLAKAQALQTLLESEYEKIGKARADLDAKLAEKGLKLKDLEIRKKEFEAKLEGKRGTARRKLQRDFLRVNEKQGFKLIDNFNKIETEGKKSVDSIINQLNEEDLFDELFKGKGKGSGEKFAGKFVESFYNEIAGIADVVADEDFDEISDTAKITGTIIIKPKIDNPDPEDLEDLTFYLDKYKQLISGVSDFLQGETDRQLTIEQNKTNVLNKELNDRLLNENLSKDERAKIQNQIAINDEELRKKQNKIKKKAFDTQKAFNISIAVADTIAAGINASKQTYGGAFAKIAAMTAVIGAGMAQVAVIARQKFQPEAASTPINTTGGGSGGAGTSERAEPSYNIVGRSNENLLINAIQAQFGKPLKA